MSNKDVEEYLAQVAKVKGCISPESEALIKSWGIAIPNGVQVIAAEAVVPDDDMVLVCGNYTPGDTLMFPDNLTGNCSWCGRPVQYRPKNEHIGKNTKICFDCGRGKLANPN